MNASMDTCQHASQGCGATSLLLLGMVAGRYSLSFGASLFSALSHTLIETEGGGRCVLLRST